MEKEAETAACPWQTLTLQFWDPDLEVEFTKHQFDSLTLHLNSHHLFARSFVFASISGGLMRKDRSLLFYQLTAAMNGIIYAAMAVGSFCRCKWLMTTWSWLIFCTRVLGDGVLCLDDRSRKSTRGQHNVHVGADSGKLNNWRAIMLSIVQKSSILAKLHC